MYIMKPGLMSKLVLYIIVLSIPSQKQTRAFPLNLTKGELVIAPSAASLISIHLTKGELVLCCTPSNHVTVTFWTTMLPLHGRRHITPKSN